MANNIVATWGFKRKLPEPFEDYTDHAIFDDIASKYCTQPRKKSTLHAATLRAVLAYLELENPVGSTPPEKLGAVGTQSNNFVVAEYPSKTGDLQVVVYNQLNGKFYGGCYTPPPDVESTPEKYEFKDSKQSGAALLFALMPVFLADEECNEKYQELKAHRDNGYPDLDAAAETAAVLCDNIYRRTRYASGLPTGGVKIDLPANGVLSLIKPLNIQKGVYAPTEVLHGDFQVLRPGSGFKKAQAAISRDDFVGKFILTASRRLSPEEEVSVPTLAEWYIIPPEIKRICEHAKLTTDTTQPMRNFLLRGPAGTGKSQIAYAVARILKLPWTTLDMSSINDPEQLTGSSRIYANAKPGIIMEAFSIAGESNLVFIINELDKAASGKGNGNPADVLLTLLDNLGFTDNYMECMIPTVGVYPIATANNKEDISAPLMSRFAVIDIPDYTFEEKKIIFSKFALPKVLKRIGLKENECIITEDGLDAVIEEFKNTSGIRDLEQAAEHLAANALYQIEVDHVPQVTFDAEGVRHLFL